MYIGNCSRKKTWVLGWTFYIRVYIYPYLFIWKSVDVYTGYVVADRDGNMNIGQYHSS